MTLKSSCTQAVTTPLYLLCFGPDNVLQIGCKALTDPLLSPVLGSDDQAEPGVGNLVANSGAAQGQAILQRTGTPSVQHTLGQENYMGAGEGKKLTQKNDKSTGLKVEVQITNGAGTFLAKPFGLSRESRNKTGRPETPERKCFLGWEEVENKRW